MSPSIFLLPGWPFSAQAMHGLAGHLADQNLPARLLELPWHAGPSPDAWVDRLMADIDENSLLVGWSLGGMLASKLAERCPERVERVIMLGSNVRFIQDSSWPTAMVPATFERFYQLFKGRPETAIAQFEQLCIAPNTPTDIMTYRANVPYDHMLAGLDVLAGLSLSTPPKIPTAALMARGDRLVPRTAAAALTRASIETDLIEGSHHDLITQPEALEWVLRQVRT
ncbi:alpha/beta fold hydrolase [Larsenimonas suaedae]|uniref:Alpha/beta fold hydrolase n=1 Tax=Larsenimonas suaedae TaxID=1851019 RepID=A0ABU1GXF5_9GAMM|nr:alpha/beta fold hydrolase [Larsenimonas suaedae]MCM2971474.1 alpha/beta fold hydrolase [Larsenimonas suaedae]MDR5896730.1 alpha/beta fold hydrolase [Larsenimonas suaedae]